MQLLEIQSACDDSSVTGLFLSLTKISNSVTPAFSLKNSKIKRT